MKREVFVLLSVLSVFVCSVCATAAPIDKLKLDSFEIVRIEPLSDTSATAVVALTLDNSFKSFEVSSVNVLIKIDGQEYARMSTNKNEILSLVKGRQTQHFSVDISMPSSLNPLLILGVLKTYDRPRFSIDVELRPALRGGFGKTIKISRDLDDIDFGLYVKQGLEGLSFNKELMNLFFKKFYLIGNVSSFDLMEVNVKNRREADAEMRVGLNITNLPVNQNLVLTKMSCVLKLDGEPLLTLISEDGQYLQEKDKRYTLNVSGDFNDVYNPCMLLSFLKSRKHWPKLSADCTVWWKSFVKIEFTIPTS